MNFRKIQGYIRLSRPVNLLITFISVPVACWISGGFELKWSLFLVSGLTGALVAAGANAINDSFDIEADRVNRPERPLPAGMLTKREAVAMWFVTSLLAVVLNILIDPYSLLVVLFCIVILYYYSAKLKKTVLFGNITVASMTAAAFIYGGIVAKNIGRALIPALFAFLVNLGRELIKDAEDVEGDKIINAATLPVKYGQVPVLILSTVILCALIGTTVSAALSGMYNGYFSYLIAATDLLIATAITLIWLNRSAVFLRRASMLIKTSMITGLIAIIAGSI
jgi:geranylgeranylglycerol-phosphate geranylgeranyltransferase